MIYLTLTVGDIKITISYLDQLNTYLSARDPGVVALEQLVHGELDGGVGDQHQRGLRPVPEAAQPLLQRAQLSITSCRFEALS